jgi:hypothetical protein
MCSVYMLYADLSLYTVYVHLYTVYHIGRGPRFSAFVLTLFHTGEINKYLTRDKLCTP